jgi:phosphatidylglycerophosphatase A
MKRLALVVATCAGVGYVPWAPGTFGSAVGLVLLGGVRSSGSVVLEIAVLAVVLVAGVWSGSIAEREAGRVDPGMVVIDEVAGMLITLALIPLTLTTVTIGFFVFRALDIFKPWPAGRVERFPGGTGIMADDAIAGLYGNLATRGLIGVASGWLT